jgi:hypothetical protein
MIVPGFTASAALAAQGGPYRQTRTAFVAPHRGAVIPQAVQWCFPCRNGVKVCCNPNVCYLVQCYPA